MPTETPEITPAAPSASAAPAATAPTGDWFSRLTPELQADPALVPFKGKSETDLATSLATTTKRMSGSITLPDATATPEQRTAALNDVYTKLGRPATAADYKITTPTLPENVSWDAAQVETFKPLAHEIGLSQGQVEKLIQYDAQRAIQARQTMDAQLAGWQADLTKDWGAQYAGNKALAIRGMTEYGGSVLNAEEGKALLNLLDATGIGDFPPLIKIFAAIGKAHSEGHLITGSGGGGGERKSAAELMYGGTKPVTQ